MHLWLAVVVTAIVLLPVPAAAQELPDPVEDLLGAAIVEHEILTTEVSDPTVVEVTADGRVLIAERTGRIKIWHQDGRLVEAGRIGVDSQNDVISQCSDCPGDKLDEGGLHGLLLAPDFETTGNVYVYYSVPNSVGTAPNPPNRPGYRDTSQVEGRFRLSRLTLRDDVLDLSSEVPLFENPAEWEHCCHYGGNLEWLPDGTLLLSVGDDTISSESNGYAPRDERPDHRYNNADLTSQNLADRRGKLLRIDVRDVDSDGSLVPVDNPFADDAQADPFVYALGLRSPWKFAVDPASGTAIVGNVGPDAALPDPTRGPAAHDELEVVPPGGGTNHGWPRCIADNQPYFDYSWETNLPGDPLSCNGMTPAALYYPYLPNPLDTRWPQIGPAGGSTIIGGVTYRYEGDGALALPEGFRNHHLFADWSRGSLMTLPINPDGTLEVGTEDLQVIDAGLTHPGDLSVGPDGAVYVAEYGEGYYNAGGSRISRLTCLGCTPDSADYGGAPVRRAVRSMSVAPVATAEPPVRTAALLLVLVGAGALAARRRRGVV